MLKKNLKQQQKKIVNNLLKKKTLREHVIVGETLYSNLYFVQWKYISIIEMQRVLCV